MVAAQLVAVDFIHMVVVQVVAVEDTTGMDGNFMLVPRATAGDTLSIHVVTWLRVGGPKSMAGTLSTRTVTLLKIGGPTCSVNDAYMAEKIITMARHVVAVVGVVTAGVVVVVQAGVVQAHAVTAGVVVGAGKTMTNTPDITTNSGWMLIMQ
ncbi:hypothetical protein RHMOL_Rhmol05G0047900 [Rhododendron molle]|uniref:Uncharacterized protein n=1 Tax=Rhododendron molle TaxID=49168 RepID=A0ACC0NM64_RHOML|nr:hypothetical protein RHMOL_Rhmol05G0047900 [Rhododendron molle]